jgi:tRNA-2-methylthio-N6-dimethylallyladenosine synthase
MIVQERQRAIQIRHNSEAIGSVQEVLVEGWNQATGQWIGRTSQNRTLNFVHENVNADNFTGRYMNVRVTRAGPNSLVGESVL